MPGNIRLQARSYLLAEDPQRGVRLEFDTFTCCHCNRVVVKHPQRQRPRNVCRRCMALTCDAAGCVTECHSFAADMERAVRDERRQPWLLRHWGEPIDRIWRADGTTQLVLRKDNGTTLREQEWRRSEPPPHRTQRSDE